MAANSQTTDGFATDRERSLHMKTSSQMRQTMERGALLRWNFPATLRRKPPRSGPSAGFNRGPMKRAVLWTIVLILSGFSGFKIAYAQSDDEGQIRGLLDNFSLA